jgi:exonuclease VII small subunit
LSSATGGIRALVHAKNLSRAQEVIAALKRGDFQLDESFEHEKPKT